MREIDKRARVSRRVFLQGSATAIPAAGLAAAGMGISAQAAWAQGAKNLQPHTMATLVLMARDTFPHDQLADVYYITAVTPYDAKAGADPAFRKMMESGVAELDGLAKRQNKTASYLDTPWEADRVALLKLVEKGPFFQKVRGDLVVSLYNQQAVWAKFGYEGSSADKGGYIHRGFNDLDWLPAS
ncbi:MAG: gluconate 2-dehydrogenase subunit 3 family protein [Proteobacteria bacterium]|nr:gluconate 2-dehydrogenase subunit 3 family protein [Pseudomonadota bacterium]